MSKYVWCDKVEQRRHASVCAKMKCSHIVPTDDGGFECKFENAQGKRARKRAKGMEAQNVTP